MFLLLEFFCDWCPLAMATTFEAWRSIGIDARQALSKCGLIFFVEGNNKKLNG
jgi:hypothetical protein